MKGDKHRQEKSRHNQPTGPMILAWSLVLAWMGLIFFFSTQPGSESAQLSGNLTRMLVDRLSQVIPEGQVNIQTIHFLLRKYAHFFIYLVLGILVLNAWLKTRPFKRRLLLYAFLVCLGYAVFDEVHQTFVPGRSGEVMDVLIDAAGSISGILIFWLIRVRRLLPGLKQPQVPLYQPESEGVD